jgi:phosphopantothenoylcysteine synthetase/decarboxylase
MDPAPLPAAGGGHGRAMPRRILVVGGAPLLAVDAVRFLSVRASGDTAVRLRGLLEATGTGIDLLLGELARPEAPARRYRSREDLENGLKTWLGKHPDGVVVMSAAINDYRVAAVESARDGSVTTHPPAAKVPSGADELVIRLRPADKVIDRLAGWGHRGPLVGFKYEDAATVTASAAALRRRTGATVVVANSLCGSVQALVDDRVVGFPDRDALLAALADRIRTLAG